MPQAFLTLLAHDVVFTIPSVLGPLKERSESIAADLSDPAADPQPPFPSSRQMNREIENHLTAGPRGKEEVEGNRGRKAPARLTYNPTPPRKKQVRGAGTHHLPIIFLFMLLQRRGVASPPPVMSRFAGIQASVRQQLRKAIPHLELWRSLARRDDDDAVPLTAATGAARSALAAFFQELRAAEEALDGACWKCQEPCAVRCSECQLIVHPGCFQPPEEGGRCWVCREEVREASGARHARAAADLVGCLCQGGGGVLLDLRGGG